MCQNYDYVTPGVRGGSTGYTAIGASIRTGGRTYFVSRPGCRRRKSLLSGVVIGFEDTDQRVQGVPGAVVLGAEHNNVTVLGAQAHQRQDA